MFVRICLIALGLLALRSVSLADQTTVTVTVESSEKTATTPPFSGQRSAVDVAILLDTSNSMDGLIRQAKNQLWTIVQEFAKAKREGQMPLLRVALFEYGNTSLPASEGYIRQVVPLTDDLDQLSEALFALRTNGGDEYCGQTIDEALRRLDWTGEPNAYKAIFIAGNEPFTQGPVNFQDACRQAIERGVVVNTIHCGQYATGVAGQWKAAADLAEGEYFNIDQDRRPIQIHCPQDEIILRLNAELNRTYLWFGSAGQRADWSERQLAQDAAARAESSHTAANRVAVKAGGAYRHQDRDLVDALAADDNVLNEVEEAALPEPMQQMAPGQREAYVKEMSVKRAELQKEIAKLNVARQQHIAAQREQAATGDQEATLGEAMTTVIRSQLHSAGFEVE